MTQFLRQIMRTITLSAPTACQDAGKSYEEAVRALNTLQSNAVVLEKARVERQRNRHLNLPNTIGFAERVGLQLDDLDKLSVIHVSGTKGKGSTCAFCESILRSSGFKTGFYSSPHLVEVRERIRINGRPLAKDKFSSYFWDCFEKLEASKGDHNGEMPAYFRFLTVMAFHVFLQEKVDVAIIEVGIGGQYDCTNIIRSPVVCGVSSLGMDHVQVLGNTIDQIAWNKAGIFKPNVPAVTVQQPEDSVQVLLNRAKEIGNPLHLAPDLHQYDWGQHPMTLGIHGKMQQINASLALQLCNIWMKDQGKSIPDRQAQYNGHSERLGEVVEMAPGFTLTPSMIEGLKSCRWPGRNQTIHRQEVSYYLDGAHTVRSIEQCLDWFRTVADQEKTTLSGRVCRVLLFNATGDRSPTSLLAILQRGGFDCAAFCPNIATSSTASADQTNFTVTVDSQLSRCVRHKNTWLQLLEAATCDSHNDRGESPPKRSRTDSLDSAASEKLSDIHSVSHSTESSCRTDPGSAQVFNSIHEALIWVTQGRDLNIPQTYLPSGGDPELLKNADHIQVLCTGSLHLIGGVIHIVDPDFIS